MEKRQKSHYFKLLKIQYVQVEKKPILQVHFINILNYVFASDESQYCVIINNIFLFYFNPY